jgi:pimeloyl-ACP methyl ester carboxylesterase
MRLRLTTFLALGVLSSPSAAAEVTHYEYPFVDPLEATVIGTPAIYKADLPEQIPIEEKQVLPLRGRVVPDIFWYAASLHYTLSAQPGEAPLVFIVPGTGANFNASKSLILQRALYRAGLHVVSLASPIHPNFLVPASRSRRPGLLAEDAEDIYRVMELIRRQLQRKLQISRYDLVGYSLGATHAAFVARLDEQRRALGFERVLLINPPINLARAAAVLDQQFARHFQSIADFSDLFNRLLVQFSEFYDPSEQVLFSDELIYELYRRRPLPDSTLEALIGAAFRLVSINLLFTSDVMADLGVLVAQNHQITLAESLTPYFKAASLLDFEFYARRILYPYYLKIAPDLSFEALAERNSLRAIGDYLRDARKIGLMHNADDFLLSGDDLEYLRRVFGERAQIYPKGGHAGNMDYKDNVAYVIDFFTD